MIVQPLRRTARPCILAMAASGALGCSHDRAREGSSAAVRDSAGILVVENTGPQWQPNERWAADSVPAVVISAADDADLLRIGSPRVLADGRIVLFSGGDCEVRFYSEEGRLLATAGRCGEGPGEFGQYGRLWKWIGDSLLVVDQLSRISVVAPDGGFGRLLRLPAGPELPLPLLRGVLDDGTLVLASLRDPAGRSTPGIEQGELIVAVLPPGEDVSMLGTYPGPRFEYTEFGGRLGRGPLAFSGSTEIAAGNASVFIGFPDRYEIREFGNDGALRRIIRRSFAAVSVEQRDIDWLMQRRLEEVEGEENQRIVRRAFANLNHATEMPAFGVPVWPGGSDGGPAMIADEEGNLWVFSHYRPGAYRNLWDVFSSEGTWLGEVDLPPGLVPSQIADDFVIGVRIDDAGFQRVERYGIHKPGARD